MIKNSQPALLLRLVEYDGLCRRLFTIYTLNWLIATNTWSATTDCGGRNRTYYLRLMRTATYHLSSPLKKRWESNPLLLVYNQTKWLNHLPSLHTIEDVRFELRLSLPRGVCYHYTTSSIFGVNVSTIRYVNPYWLFSVSQSNNGAFGFHAPKRSIGESNPYLPIVVFNTRFALVIVLSNLFYC